MSDASGQKQNNNLVTLLFGNSGNSEKEVGMVVGVVAVGLRWMARWGGLAVGPAGKDYHGEWIGRFGWRK